MAYIPRFQNGSLADYTYDDSVTQPSLQNYLTAGYNQVNSELKRGAPMFSLLGQAATNMGVAPGFKPNPGLSMAGGAMQGAASGGLLGAVAGGAMGFLQGANKRGEYENLQELYNRQKIQNSTVGQNYGYYAQHGGATPGAVASQTEVGEVVLFPDNMVANVMATDKHKQMDDDEVTDMLPEGSYVFSDDKAMRFNVKDVAEKILGYGMSYYDEHGNYETEEMEMEDFLPKKGKITFAEAAKFLRSKIKTTGNRKDLFDIHTDSENMETRVPYLMELISMQDEKNASAGRVGSMLEPEEEMPMMQFGGPGERAFAAGMGAAGLPMPKEVLPPPSIDTDLLGPIGEPGARAAQAGASLLQGFMLKPAKVASTPKSTGQNEDYRKTLSNGTVLDRAYGIYDEYGIEDPGTRAIMMQESHGKPDAVSKSGYTGLFQLHKNSSAADWNIHGKDHPLYDEIGNIDSNEQLKDPKVNSVIGQWYLNERLPKMLRSFGFEDAAETKSLVAAAYNMGPGNLRKHINKTPRKKGETDAAYVKRLQAKFPTETKNYIDRFWMGYNRLQHPRQIEKKQFGSTWTIVD